METTTSLLIAVKAAVRKVEDLADINSADTNYYAWMAARDEARKLRTTISDEMSALLNSKDYEDRGDLLAKYRSLRKLHEMLAI